ncbi:MAG: DNA polymerase III subunit delta' [Ruminococcaceae bacterium]|nr:DNA polymerase III subunit delta' [Oscillospiraceae bacterium]
MSFPLVGNLKLRDAVLNALSQKHIPHAILIEGEIGSGRHTLANFIARAAVCEGDKIPCESCRGCELQKSGNHPDITVVAPEENKKSIAVAQIRELREDAFIKPHTAEHKVFIIDFADTMNEQSQNALLKVLEEPPQAVKFILIAESKSSLLPTVISRCLCLTLSAPDSESAAEYIKATHDYSEEDVASALHSSQNNIGKALGLLANEENAQDEACELFLDCALRGDSWGCFTCVSKLEKSRNEAAAFFKKMKITVARHLRENIYGEKAKALSLFYSELCDLEKSLITNINLGLLFSALISRSSEIFKQ